MRTHATLSLGLADLLSQLASAVRAGDHRRATQLAQTILRCQTTKKSDRAGLERNVRTLLARLKQPHKKHGHTIIQINCTGSEKGSMSRCHTSDGKIVVWAAASSKKSSRLRGFEGGNIIFGPSKTGSKKVVRHDANGCKGRQPLNSHEGSSKAGGQKPEVHNSKTKGFVMGRFRSSNAKIVSATVTRSRTNLSETGRSKSPGQVAIRFETSAKLHGSKPVDAKGILYPVWFGTNRKRNEDGTLGSEMSDHTITGRADVYVPKAHRFGETGNGFWKRLLRLDLRDDHLRIFKLQPLKTADFFSEINEEIETARKKGEAPHALIFLHGYNVTFEEAAVRAAQIGCDLKVAGATAFFSWHSCGDVSSYNADEARIEASEAAITNFLVEFGKNCNADKVHVIAHSMGNRGLLRALQRIAANAELQGNVKFGQIFLAAPDVDRSLFIDLARLYPLHAERTTLYASAGDRAVHLSAILHAAPRAGYYTPYTVVTGVDTITVPDFNVDMLGHSYFAQAEALLHDIHDLMRHGEAPDKRQRIEPQTCDGLSFWKLGR